MSRAADIRAWLAANPGWHFASDIADGLEASGNARVRIFVQLGNMAALGHLTRVGRHRLMRYTLGREVRKYERKTAA
ncbi:hypothetical protein [Stenotrophomonas sp. 278]|uniref:hypothetical protein n=1 Tax=Stenotrophomonas sp. 278 TaxID=2479851 RepID=UPI000F6796BD|nr:hypothetical protein [Stenotrophomonas sp. 278]RRU17837.1 hypothetical protein EGJ34_06780 [Stenotrophomonas sp. 278]